MEKVNKEIDKLIIKIEEDSMSHYTYEEVLDMLKDLQFTINEDGSK